MPEVTINGIKINYEVLGQGTPFLMLHGWGSNSERWKEVLEPISKKGFKVLVPDMPGFGKSDIPENSWDIDDYLKWLDEFLKTQTGFSENFYLAGHSFGGTLSAAYSIKNPEKVKKLFLIASACVRRKTFKKIVLADISKTLKMFKDVPLYGIARKIFYKFIVGRTDYLSVKESMKDTYLKVILHDLSLQLKKIKQETIIIWGEKDNITLLKDAYFTNKEIPNSKLIVIPNAGHDLNRKQPKELAKEIINNL